MRSTMRVVAHRYSRIALVIGGTILGLCAMRDASRSGAQDPPRTDDRARRFEAEIAPLFAKHCLECHDTASNSGNLDLSRKVAALKGGDGGPPFVPGKSAESLLWQAVESGEMPKNRAPLTDDEKQQLRRWIDDGAVWSLDAIDPDAHKAGGSATWLQRLTVPEYIETVRVAVGVDIEAEARRVLPKDRRADGFTNTAYNLGVDLSHVEAYARLARTIVGRMDAAAFARKFGNCDRLDETCLREIVSRMGKWMLRGPLDERETQVFLSLANEVVAAGGDFDEVSRYLLEAMLQSPRFVYRIERQRGDGRPRSADPYELAARMSYILWGAPPDAELIRAADAGELKERGNIEVQVARMLNDPRAVARSRQFVHDWLDLGRLASLRPNPQRFPEWDPELAADMCDETLAFFEELAWNQKRPLSDLLNAKLTVASDRLTRHYELDRPPGETRRASRQSPDRVTAGLQFLYVFEERSGTLVRDVAGTGDPINLTIADPSAVRWRESGLEIRATTLISADRSPRRFVDAVRKSNALTLEAWLTPASTAQEGPARILTLSNGVLARNFTLGQERDAFDVRLRTTATSASGTPSLSSPAGSVPLAPVHLVYTRDAKGRATIYLNGAEVAAGTVAGDLSNWGDEFRPALANELSGDRPWQGTLHLVAAYDRALSLDEIRKNHAAFEPAQSRSSGTIDAAWERRDRRVLQALYRFDSGTGDVVRDAANAGDPLDLKIADPSATRWLSDGLAILKPTLLSTSAPPRRLIDAVKNVKAISIEAWITPASLSQTGPARIVSLSSGVSQRNFTLGQEADRIEMRYRSERTDRNGIPAMTSRPASVETRPTHVVFTRDERGRARLYVNGIEQASNDLGGDLSNWDGAFPLLLANESTRDRPWLGTLHLVAIFSRALTPDEIEPIPTGPRMYDLAEYPGRGGILTHGSVLTIGGDEASMVARGLFVLHDLLYSRVGNPPPCVNTTPVPTKPGLTQRAIAMQRLADATCSGCHAKFEPLAFGLEKFDGIGVRHEVDEHGNALREDGEVLFPGTAEPVSYRTSAELMDLLAGSDRVRMGITRKVTQFALGRPLVAADAPHLDKIHADAQARGGTYPALVTAIVLSDLVLQVRTESATLSESQPSPSEAQP